MAGFANELNRLNNYIKQDNSKSLKKHLHLGDILEFAFKKFMVEKRKTKIKKWIQSINQSILLLLQRTHTHTQTLQKKNQK